MDDDLDADARFVDAGDTRVRYFADGPADARPVVLLHGDGMDSASVAWKEAFPALAAEYRVYAPDLPGHGGSDPVPEDETPDVTYYVDVVKAFLSALDVREATLVGISLGGGVALEYTLETPARVSGLVLVDSYGLGDDVADGVGRAALAKAPGAQEVAWWAIRRSRRLTRAAIANRVHPDNLDASLVAEVYDEIRRPGTGAAHHRVSRGAVGATGSATASPERVDELPVPALFVHGADDELIPAEHSKRASDAAPVADRFTLADCGHWPPREHPEAFVSRLRAWMET